ncbi:uncharacterized protein SAPINGB_P002428 [Magnusiomyces paraingens]|uniref:Mitochondrial zinc maintenance protein 1, mitochondrial n=1 Tax=Magnusiomyces paraingens TaxID=2606893 RepID=A0A5E8BJM6_9ASCO|nr:uncharacterized protein SAPINGB_P002428 [Saprochaete ingens]VVT49757.1 unnamed protein product [Saprochaete ingens]
MSQPAAVLQSYRNLLRSCKYLFANDVPRLTAALAEIRTRFHSDKSLSEPEEIAEKLQLAKDVNIILRQNVVQGVQDSADPNKYHLKIHKETELGYNDTVKEPKITPQKPITGKSKRAPTNLGSRCGGH